MSDKKKFTLKELNDRFARKLVKVTQFQGENVYIVTSGVCRSISVGGDGVLLIILMNGNQIPFVPTKMDVTSAEEEKEFIRNSGMTYRTKLELDLSFKKMLCQVATRNVKIEQLEREAKSISDGFAHGLLALAPEQCVPFLRGLEILPSSDPERIWMFPMILQMWAKNTIAIGVGATTVISENEFNEFGFASFEHVEEVLTALAKAWEGVIRVAFCSVSDPELNPGIKATFTVVEFENMGDAKVA